MEECSDPNVTESAEGDDAKEYEVRKKLKSDHNPGKIQSSTEFSDTTSGSAPSQLNTSNLEYQQQMEAHFLPGEPQPDSKLKEVPSEGIRFSLDDSFDNLEEKEHKITFSMDDDIESDDEVEEGPYPHQVSTTNENLPKTSKEECASKEEVNKFSLDDSCTESDSDSSDDTMDLVYLHHEDEGRDGVGYQGPLVQVVIFAFTHLH